MSDEKMEEAFLRLVILSRGGKEMERIKTRGRKKRILMRYTKKNNRRMGIIGVLQISESRQWREKNEDEEDEEKDDVDGEVNEAMEESGVGDIVKVNNAERGKNEEKGAIERMFM